jgi:hypothetical protein
VRATRQVEQSRICAAGESLPRLPEDSGSQMSTTEDTTMIFTIETVPAGEWDAKGGFKIDGSVVQWWPTKTQAIAGAKAIGWPVKSVTRVWTRFQMGYALLETFGGLVTKAGYESILNG